LKLGRIVKLISNNAYFLPILILRRLFSIKIAYFWHFSCKNSYTPINQFSCFEADFIEKCVTFDVIEASG